jgi:hypothetical protein
LRDSDFRQPSLTLHSGGQRFGRIGYADDLATLRRRGDQKDRQTPVSTDPATVVGVFTSPVLNLGMQVGGFDGQ